jgi:hypothetical protein
MEIKLIFYACLILIVPMFFDQFITPLVIIFILDHLFKAASTIVGWTHLRTLPKNSFLFYPHSITRIPQLYASLSKQDPLQRCLEAFAVVRTFARKV